MNWEAGLYPFEIFQHNFPFVQTSHHPSLSLWIFECEDSECLLETSVSTNYYFFFTPVFEGDSIFFLLSYCQSTAIYIALSSHRGCFWLSIKNLVTSFLDIPSVHQRCSPLAILGLLGITEGENLASSLYEESNEAPAVSDSYSIALIWQQCKGSTCFSFALTWLFSRLSEVRQWVKLRLQLPDLLLTSCCPLASVVVVCVHGLKASPLLRPLQGSLCWPTSASAHWKLRCSLCTFGSLFLIIINCTPQEAKPPVASNWLLAPDLQSFEGAVSKEAGVGNRGVEGLGKKITVLVSVGSIRKF